MDPVVHFELPAEDRKRIVDFYTKVFGWQTKQMGPEMGEYVVVTTTEIDEKTNRPKTAGAINGGFYLKSDNPVGQHPSVVISVDDVDESIKKVEAAGGKIHGEIYNIPGVGRFVSIIDTEGNHISMLQPAPEMM